MGKWERDEAPGLIADDSTRIQNAESGGEWQHGLRPRAAAVRRRYRRMSFMSETISRRAVWQGPLVAQTCRSKMGVRPPAPR